MAKFTQPIKLILAILFFLCLLDMPYAYYQLTRFAALIGFAILAYHAYEEENQIEMYIFIALAVFFQPLLKISLGRTLWNIIDVIVAIGLLIHLITDATAKNDREPTEKS